jgi:hypothetical protein
MFRTATEYDPASIRALIKSIPGLWHAEWRSDALERAIGASDSLSFVWEEAGYILGFSCAHEVGFLGYLSLLVLAGPGQFYCATGSPDHWLRHQSHIGESNLYAGGS